MPGKFLLKFCILAISLCVIWSAPSQAQTIRFAVGGAKFPTVSGQLSVSITVDALTPTVAVGTVADQMFRDDTVGASYFGYYLSTSARTTAQPSGTVHLQIQKWTGETANRSYYLMENGVTVPNDETDLTIAPSSRTTIATFARNAVRCGTNYLANGLDNVNGTNCTPATVQAGMDVTQFVKVLWSDPPSAAIVSKLSFTLDVF